MQAKASPEEGVGSRLAMWRTTRWEAKRMHNQTRLSHLNRAVHTTPPLSVTPARHRPGVTDSGAVVLLITRFCDVTDICAVVPLITRFCDVTDSRAAVCVLPHGYGSRQRGTGAVDVCAQVRWPQQRHHISAVSSFPLAISLQYNPV